MSHEKFSNHDQPMHPLSPVVRRIAARWFGTPEIDLSDVWPRPVGLLVGEQPRPGGNSKLPLWPWPDNCAGARLFRMSDMDLLSYFKLLARANVAEESVVRWNANWARTRGIQLLSTLPEGCRVVACGARARDALGIGDFFRLQWISREDGSEIQCVAIPHPSGRNLLYNDPDNKKLARGYIRWAARLR